jgi:signal transduction histidine kinase
LAILLREAEPELDNAGLRAAMALQLEDVRASRGRLAAAQLEERRRVERDLHDGAQQRLLALAAQFQAALLNGQPARLREALVGGVEQSQAAVRELRELANGLHPSVLADGGLAAALDDLAARHGVQVDVAEPGRRYPQRIEATAWFIACEAVTNAVKHARAEGIRVHVVRQGNELRISVDDDGLGGADPSGNGLRGLADRAEAVGGLLLVQPRQPCGTTISAVLPCGS